MTNQPDGVSAMSAELSRIEAPRYTFCLHGQPMCSKCAASATFGEQYVREWASYWRNRAINAEGALRKLVSLEDMRLRLQSLHERGHGTDYEQYHKGLPQAWDTARSVLLRLNHGVER
jgi:hypothetical protein